MDCVSSPVFCTAPSRRQGLAFPAHRSDTGRPRQRGAGLRTQASIQSEPDSTRRERHISSRGGGVPGATGLAAGAGPRGAGSALALTKLKFGRRRMRTPPEDAASQVCGLAHQERIRTAKGLPALLADAEVAEDDPQQFVGGERASLRPGAFHGQQGASGSPTPRPGGCEGTHLPRLSGQGLRLLRRKRQR